MGLARVGQGQKKCQRERSEEESEEGMGKESGDE